MRLIDADACIKELERIWNIPHDWDGDIDETCETAFDVIENQPTVEANPVVTGEWIPISEKPKEEGTYIVAWLPAFKDEKGEKHTFPCPYPHFYTLGDYYDDEWDIKVPSAYDEYILLAWMPLPQPYNAERGGKNE